MPPVRCENKTQNINSFYRMCKEKSFKHKHIFLLHIQTLTSGSGNRFSDVSNQITFTGQTKWCQNL